MNDKKWWLQVFPQSITAMELVCETSYSSVIKITSDSQIYFAKTNHREFSCEAKLIDYLYKKNLNILPLYAQNEKQNSFITSSMGYQAEKYLNEHTDKSVVYKIIDSFLNIQKNARLQDLVFMGVRTFDSLELEALLGNYNFYCNSQEMIETQEYIQAFIPLALEHGDFHLGNILIDGERVAFIDWAEATITNPLFSILAFLNTLKYRANFTLEQIITVKEYCLGAFARVNNLTLDKTKELYSLSEKLFPFYMIWGYRQLLKTGPNAEYTQKIEKKIAMNVNQVYALWDE